MATATDLELPTRFTTPPEVVAYMKDALNHAEFRPAALMPRITLVRGGADGADYEMGVTGADGYGGPQSVEVHLDPVELANPLKARITFRLAYSGLLGKVGDALNRLNAAEELGPD